MPLLHKFQAGIDHAGANKQGEAQQSADRAEDQRDVYMVAASQFNEVPEQVLKKRAQQEKIQKEIQNYLNFVRIGNLSKTVSDALTDAVLAAGPFQHGFTYAGNPLACAAGLAVIGEIERLNLMENAVSTGAILKAELTALMDRFPCIGDVRGMGVLLALELVSDRQTKAPLDPALKAFDRLTEHAYQRGLIIYPRRSRGGYSGDHFLIAPPMITTAAQVGEIMERLVDALAGFAGECGLE